MNELLFHSSWWLLACVAAGGIAIFIAGNRRLDKKLQRIGLAVFALAAILGFLRFFFPTRARGWKIAPAPSSMPPIITIGTALRKLLDPATAVCSPIPSPQGRKRPDCFRRGSGRRFLKVKSVSIIGIDSAKPKR